MSARDVTTAACILFPADVCPAVQQLREKHDPAYPRWKAHINLAFPFIAKERFANVAEKLKHTLSFVSPFQVTLTKFSSFTHGTIFLEPDAESTRQIAGLRNLLEEYVPECKLQFEFHPHLTVGKWKKSELVETVEKLNQQWSGMLPITFEVNALYFISRDAADNKVPFEIHTTLPLSRQQQ